jgi:hypothetical protein
VELGILTNIGNTYHYYTEGAVDGKPTTSFGAGLMSQFNFGKWAFRPEVHYDRIKAQHPAGKIVANNLTIPVSVVLQYSDILMSMDVFLGGYYSYCIEGKQGNEKIDFKNTFNRDEFGLTFGVGLSFKPIKIGFTSRSALTNFTKNPNSDKAHIQNITTYFTLTYYLF